MPDAAASAMENTPRQGPALSATSDMPVIDVTDHGKGVEGEATIEVPAKEAASEQVETPETEDTETEKRTRDDRRVPVGEVTKARNKAREAEARSTEAQDRLDKALAALEQATAKPVQGRPVRAEYADPEAYDTALMEYAAQEARTKAVNEERQRAHTETVEASNKKLIADWEVKKADFIKDHADYADVAENEDVAISIPMSRAILTSENGPAIAYWLGQNPDEAQRIMELGSDVAQIRELGRIEAKLTQTVTRQAKPAPIRPVGQGSAGKAAPTYEDLDQMSMAEYAAHVQARDSGGSLAH